MIVFFKEALNETGISTNLQIRTRCIDIVNFIGNEPGKFPQLIFLDLNMPLVSGHECLKAIRNLSYLNSIPIITYSTTAIKDEVQSTYYGGANLYLQKPSSSHLLVFALKKILQHDWSNYITELDKKYFVFKHIQSNEAAWSAYNQATVSKKELK